MDAIIEVGNNLGFNPSFLTFSLCDLEHIISLPNFKMTHLSELD